MINKFFALKAGEMAFVVSIYLGVVSIFAFWTQSNLNFYLSYFQDKTVEVEYSEAWLTTALTLFISGLALFGNALGSVIRLFL